MGHEQAEGSRSKDGYPYHPFPPYSVTEGSSHQCSGRSGEKEHEEAYLGFGHAHSEFLDEVESIVVGKGGHVYVIGKIENREHSFEKTAFGEWYQI